MCLICSGEYKGMNNLDVVDCNECPHVTTIPHIPGVIKIYCRNCPKIVSIPHIKGLRHLLCYNCPNLEYIPDIRGLTLLICDNCPNLKQLPNIRELQILFCTNCPLLKYIPNKIYYLHTLECDPILWSFYKQNPSFSSNLNKLITIQRFIRKWLKIKKLLRWLSTPSFSEWYYLPYNPGGQRAIKRLSGYTHSQ